MVAAPRWSGGAGPTGFDVVNAAARRLRDRPAAADEVKPWHDLPTPERELWHRHATAR
jgi:hypothetical protein